MSLSTRIEQASGQLRRLETALGPPFDVVLAPAPLEISLHRFWRFDQRQQACSAAIKGDSQVAVLLSPDERAIAQRHTVMGGEA